MVFALKWSRKAAAVVVAIGACECAIPALAIRTSTWVTEWSVCRCEAASKASVEDVRSIWIRTKREVLAFPRSERIALHLEMSRTAAITVV